jgi:N-acetylneuraminate synthase
VRGSSIFSKIAETRLPVFLSTGMSPLSEIDAAVARIRARGLPLVVLQCTTAYPCPPESVGLNMIGVYRERYGCAVGLSDHSGTIFPGIVAASMEIAMLEVHVALSREMFGPDVSASVTTTEFRELVKGVRFVERMTAHPVDKDALAGDLRDIRALFTKSVVARRDMPAGTLITQEDIAFRKPGTGIPEEEADRVLNRKLKVPVAANTQILEEHFE